MKTPHLELLKPLLDSSFSVKHYLVNQPNDRASFWHFHPELEIVYVKGGSGIRHVGNHISGYHDGDLVLIGSNLPHSGFTDILTGNSEEIVIHFDLNFISKEIWDIPEMSSIKNLLESSANGIAFHGNAKEEIGGMIRILSKISPFDRLLMFLRILKAMAETKDVEILNAKSYVSNIKESKNERAASIYQFIKDNFNQSITLEDIAKVSSMTVPSFCRYFKSLSDKTFTKFLNEYRIIESCKLLKETDLPVKIIAHSVGFNSIAHFNKHFKLQLSKTPKEYRNQINRVDF